MHRKKYILQILFAFILLESPFYLSGQIKQTETDDSGRQVRLSWDKVSEAVKYRIAVRDQEGKEIIVRDSDTPSVILELAPGTYKIRIGVVNKFQKIGSWSDWTDITIEEPKPVVVKGKKPVKKDLFGTGLKASAGMSYYDILPEWDGYFENSFSGFNIDIAYSLKLIKFPSFLNFLKFSGIEIDFSIIKFNGIEKFNRIESDLTDIIPSLNLFFSTNFNFPVNAAIRSGGGISVTRQDYQKYNTLGDPSEKGREYSYDFFYIAGLSIEYRFYSFFFVEWAADFYSINYLVKEFNCFRYTMRAGIRL